jgi:hypothetical protein
MPEFTLVPRGTPATNYPPELRPLRWEDGNPKRSPRVYPGGSASVRESRYEASGDQAPCARPNWFRREEPRRFVKNIETDGIKLDEAVRKSPNGSINPHHRFLEYSYRAHRYDLLHPVLRNGVKRYSAGAGSSVSHQYRVNYCETYSS